MAVDIRSVLVSDAVDPLCVDLLKSHGINVVCKYKLPKDQLIQEVQKHDGLIVRSDTKVTKEIIDSSPNLRVIGRAGTGVDNIDLDAATKKGIIVINTPGGNSISACEMTCALITSLARNVAQAAQSLREGRWDRKLYTGSELYGKTLGVLGLGRIGREVAIRMTSYGMKVIGFDPIVSAEEAKSFNVEKLELDEIWPLADYITVHTPLIPQTRNLINEATLTRGKKGVRIVNVARGGIIDEAALLAALKDGRCGGAALDVYVEEPPKNPITLELIKHPQVVATPHLGASTGEAQQRVAIEIGEQFIALAGKNKEGESYIVNGAVNAPVLSATLDATNLPWITLAEKLGTVLGKLIKDPSGTKIKLITRGSGLNNKRFLNTPLLTGVLSQSKSGLNLINSPAVAKDLAVEVDYQHQDGGQLSLEVSAGGHAVVGTVGANNAPAVISIDGAVFHSAGVPITDNIIIATGKTVDLPLLVKEIVQNGGKIQIVSVTPSVILVQTSEPLVKKISLSGVNIF